MKYVVVLSILILSTSAIAETDFCRGFEIGYKTAKGNNDVFVPFCPLEPFTPFGSTPFQEGLKAGLEAAND